MAVDISNLHDNYKILEPGAFSSIEYPLLKSYSLKTMTVRKIANLIHYTSGYVTMQMLQIFEDGHEHNYREIVEKLFSRKRIWP